MEQRVSGRFDVELTPERSDEAGGVTLGRLGIDKRYHGDLDATGQGTMLSARTPVESSAGYVAMERVDGALGGRTGSFVLQHSGTMAGGEQELSVTVVPDSGTGELVGIAGELWIEIADGEHRYDFAYTLPEG